MEFIKLSEDFIQLPPQNVRQYCSGCSRKISLSDTETFMCAQCKNYLCEECGIFYHKNVSKTVNNCPGDPSEPHNTVLVKITRNIKEFNPTGVPIQNLEKNPNLGRTISRIKIDDGDSKPKSSKKALILDEQASDEPTTGTTGSKKSRVLILDDDS